MLVTNLQLVFKAILLSTNMILGSGLPKTHCTKAQIFRKPCYWPDVGTASLTEVIFKSPPHKVSKGPRCLLKFYATSQMHTQNKYITSFLKPQSWNPTENSSVSSSIDILEGGQLPRRAFEGSSFWTWLNSGLH